MDSIRNLSGFEIYAVILAVSFLFGLVLIYKLYKRSPKPPKPPVYTYDDFISKE